MARDAPTVLIVDDEPLNRDLLEQELDHAGYRTLCACAGEAALQLCTQEAPELILLDVMMHGLDGYATCERLKSAASTRSVPVIFLTALSDTFDKVRAFRAGAVDYVTKPFETEELLARVGTHIALRREIDAHIKSRATIRLLLDHQRPAADAMIGTSVALRRVREQIALVANTDSTVLIQGETGTGKELVASAIHAQSPRRDQPLIRLNCAALPRELVESELFGHEKGAFTGATQQRRGRFELADGGSLFLDEVGELPLDAQAKLLRVLQEREFERVGGSRSLRSNVRVIAATNRQLQAQVAAGAFRADLYYRLNVFLIIVPPLRERREDIPPLVDHFARAAARRIGRDPGCIAAEFVKQAVAYAWPGNVRELQNVVERAMIMGGDASLLPQHPLGGAQPISTSTSGLTQQGGLPACETLEAVERAHIRHVLQRTAWRIEGADGAAALLGLNPSTLRGRMRKLGISRGG